MTTYIDIDVWLDEQLGDIKDEIDIDDILDELDAYSQSHQVELGISLTGDLDEYTECYHTVELDDEEVKDRIRDYVTHLEGRIRWLREANRELDDELTKHTRSEKAMEFYRNAL